jgi:uncharacterized protein (UPF0332 family)
MSSLPNVNFNPVEFYQLASILYENNSEEVIYRTIVSRSYYSAFLCARESAGIKSNENDGHKKVIDYFKSRNKTISNQLQSLKNLRHDADYELNNSIKKRDAQESLRLARSILTTLNHLPS